MTVSNVRYWPSTQEGHFYNKCLKGSMSKDLKKCPLCKHRVTVLYTDLENKRDKESYICFKCYENRDVV